MNNRVNKGIKFNIDKYRAPISAIILIIEIMDVLMTFKMNHILI